MQCKCLPHPCSMPACLDKRIAPSASRFLNRTAPLPRTGVAQQCHRHGQERRSAISAAPRFNPQNVADPQVMPQLSFSPEEAVASQLNALSANDTPWPNHGLQTMFSFGEDIGGMERSRFFGYSKDLYHFDHFLGHFQNVFPELINADSYDVVEAGNASEDGTVRVAVRVRCKGSVEEHCFAFVMKQKELGRKKGCWMTKTILQVEQ